MAEYLQNLLRRPPIGWWDVLDILVVSFLIYEFLKLIRGTRAVQMAVGSLLLVALFYVSRLAPLQTVNWMIRNMLAFVAFGVSISCRFVAWHCGVINCFDDTRTEGDCSFVW